MNSPSPSGRGPGGGPSSGRRKPRDPVLIERARALRNAQTEAEQKLWSKLRGRQLDGRKFSRQIGVEGVIADFACREARLIIELDGSQHANSIDYDTLRDARLTCAGWRVLRFWNRQIFLELDAVLATIFHALTNPPPNPLPEGEGELE